MRLATGRELFFDAVAEELMLSLGEPHPGRIALTAAVSGVTTVEDIAALSRALCRYFRPDDHNYIESNSTNVAGLSFADAYSVIVDAERRPLKEIMHACKSIIDDPERVLVISNFSDDGADITHLSYVPQEQRDIIASALEKLFKSCGKEFSQLAVTRFQLGGFTAVARDYALFSDPRKGSWKDDSDRIQRFYSMLSSKWRYRNAIVPPDKIAGWVRQFASDGFEEEARAILVYLSRYGYVTEGQIISGLTHSYWRYRQEVAGPYVPVSFQPPGKSESKLAYNLKPAIKLVVPEEAVSIANELGELVRFVCFDDCIGSGETVEDYLFGEERLAGTEELISLVEQRRATIHIIVYHSDERGIKRITDNPEAFGAITVETVVPLDSTHKAFSDDTRIVSESGRRNDFGRFCYDVGSKLKPEAPLGWGDCEWCVTYDYSIPDNSLPIFACRWCWVDIAVSKITLVLLRLVPHTLHHPHRRRESL